MEIGGEEKKPEKYDIKKAIVVPVCTDRGLCGGVNSQLMKRAKLLVAEKAAEGIECKYITIGDKATPILLRYAHSTLARTPTLLSTHTHTRARINTHALTRSLCRHTCLLTNHHHHYRDSGDKVLVSFGDVAKKPLTFTGVGVICDKIFEQDPDQVFVIYNQFNNIISNTLTIKDVPSHKVRTLPCTTFL